MRALSPEQRMLIEYKPFEPAFYHTDIADWGMALQLRAEGRPAGAGAGRHRPSLSGAEHRADRGLAAGMSMLGGFHFNDRRYADDDLTLGSIDPYQVFRIFHEIPYIERENAGGRRDIAYMIDQSHNLKGKIEAMIQTV